MKNIISKKINMILSMLLAVSLMINNIGVVTINTYADTGTESVYGEEIWMGWTYFENGGAGYNQTGGDKGSACGRYQFDYRYSLQEFLLFCINNDAEKFGAFLPYTKINKTALKSNQAFYIVWSNIYNKYPDEFSELQDQFAYDKYYVPIKTSLLKKGIDLDDYSPILKGTAYSLSIRDGADSGAATMKSVYKAGLTEEEWLESIYAAETAKHPSQSNRWSNLQLTAARSGGTVFPMNGTLGALLSSSGEMYHDYVKDWIEEHKNDLSKTFIETGGWNTSNKEWATTLRTAGDWYELYGIKGGELDFTTGVSGGIYIDGISINAETYQIPDNDSNNPVVYLGQSNGAGGSAWANVPFGGRNIAYSGCSVTSLSMVISYLLGGVNRDNWVFPNEVVAAISDKYGNYNHFYAGDSGQSWDIFPAVAQIYGLNCTQISSGSILTSLKNGNPVIMSCKPGEFTSKGHFIVITGCDDEGYCYVNDPSHPDKSSKKYTAQFLANQGKGWWSFSK